jgi:hypothetical protein
MVLPEGQIHVEKSSSGYRSQFSSVSLAVGKACIIPPTGGIEYKKRKRKEKKNTHTHSKSPM